MNCKPGELAIVVGDPVHIHDGRIVLCVRPDSDPGFQGCWITEPELYDADGTLYAPMDNSLRPIRDPGDDARDETLEWLPVPSRETEAA